MTAINAWLGFSGAGGGKGGVLVVGLWYIGGGKRKKRTQKVRNL